MRKDIPESEGAADAFHLDAAMADSDSRTYFSPSRRALTVTIVLVRLSILITTALD